MGLGKGVSTEKIQSWSLASVFFRCLWIAVCIGTPLKMLARLMCFFKEQGGVHFSKENCMAAH